MTVIAEGQMRTPTPQYHAKCIRLQFTSPSSSFPVFLPHLFGNLITSFCCHREGTRGGSVSGVSGGGESSLLTKGTKTAHYSKSLLKWGKNSLQKKLTIFRGRCCSFHGN
jgi:hypothetical protein